MPNYPLSSYDAAGYAVNRAFGLCNTHNKIIESDFPLSHTEIADAIAPERVRHLLTELREANISSVRSTSIVRAIIRDEEMPRAALVSISVRPEVFYSFEPQSYNHITSYVSADRDFHRELPFDMASLNPDSRRRLVNWLNMAVRERRRTALTMRMVREFLDYTDHRCDTTYHLRARWPALTMLFDGHRVYENRVREVPRNLNRWRWQGDAWEWHDKNEKAIAVAEQMLLGASLISADIKTITGPVMVEISDWQRINGEKI